MTTPSKPVTIDQTSRITVWVMMALLGMTGTGTWIVADLKNSVDELDETLTEFKDSIDRHTSTLTENGKELVILKTRQEMHAKRLDALEAR